MAQSVRNIIVGAAALFLSANTKQDGTAAQAYPTMTGNALDPTTSSSTNYLNDAAKWKDVGFTSSGLELSYEPNYGEITVDQELDAARLFKQGQKVMLKTEFAEATLDNLFIVMNQASGLTGSSVSGTTGATGEIAQSLEILGGALGDYPVERSLVAIGQSPRPTTAGNAQRVYYASRVMSIDTSAHGLKRDSGTFFPVNFRLLPVASSSNAYGKIVDRTF